MSASDSFKSEKPLPFDERIGMLFEELRFAIRDDRPSILVAPYASEYLRSEVESTLEQRLDSLGHSLVRLRVEPDLYDIPLLLIRHPLRKKAVFSVRSLASGGGREAANAYKALNIRRELLVENSIRLLVWLTPAESIALSRHAPDFWAFRHRVVEFDHLSDLQRLHLPPRGVLSSGPASTSRLLLRRLNADLRGSPKDAACWQSLGEFELARGRGEAARRALRKALQISPESATAWLGLGLARRLLRQPQKSLECLRRAVELDPSSAETHLSLADLCLDLGLWEEVRLACAHAASLAPADFRASFLLGRLAQMGQDYSDAIINYRRSLEINPVFLQAQCSLACCLRMTGEESMSEEQMGLLKGSITGAPPYQQAVFAALCGDASRALELLSIEMGQGRLSPLRLSRDPDLDVLRADVRFQNLLAQGMSR